MSEEYYLVSESAKKFRVIILDVPIETDKVAFQPYKVITLWDIMKKFQLESIFDLGGVLELIIEVLSPPENISIENEMKHVNDWRVAAMKEQLHNLGLDFSLKKLDRLEDKLKNFKNDAENIQELTSGFRELQERIIDETSSKHFVYIPLNKSNHIEPFVNFSAELQPLKDNYPTTVYDIESGCRCYAYNEFTACVFHLMRVMEVGLNAVYLSLGLPTLMSERDRSWGNLIKKIDEFIAKEDKANPSGWINQTFYRDVRATLNSVKDAWRNATMHIEAKYDEADAERIITAVKSFMLKLAKTIDESGKFI